MIKLFGIIFNILDKLHRAYVEYIKSIYYKSRLGYCGKNVCVKTPCAYGNLSLLYMYDNTCILHDFKLLNSTGRVILKKGAGLSSGVTIVTGNHGRTVGKPFRPGKDTDESQDIEKDIIIEEGAWVGSDVVLCSGITIGRCANVGAGAVVRNNIPPYSVAVGNPAKVVGFCFTPEEIIEHEKILFPEEERLPLKLLEKNYNKYFINRIKEIKGWTRL